jgi:divalent metal cation (Fe/Co/Zn/Cd) transporter
MVLIAGFKITSRKPDSEHPFDHGRAELIATLVIGLMLSLAAFELGAKSFKKFFTASLLIFSPV